MLHKSREAEARETEKEQQVTELKRQLEDGARSDSRVADLAEENQMLKADCERLQEQLEQAANDLQHACDGAELSRYRAVEAERLKWEAREERLVQQLQEASGSHELHPSRSGFDGPSQTDATFQPGAGFLEPTP